RPCTPRGYGTIPRAEPEYDDVAVSAASVDRIFSKECLTGRTHRPDLPVPPSGFGAEPNFREIAETTRLLEAANQWCENNTALKAGSLPGQKCGRGWYSMAESRYISNRQIDDEPVSNKVLIPSLLLNQSRVRSGRKTATTPAVGRCPSFPCGR